MIKTSRSKSGLLHTKSKAALISTELAASLDRSNSHLSTSSFDSQASSRSAASTTSAAGTWSPRTAADAQSRGTAGVRKPNRIRTSLHQTAKEASNLANTAADPEKGLLRELSLLSAVSFDSDAGLEHSTSPRLTSQHSPAKSPRRGSAASVQSYHSSLDPLPDKPTDVVRRRKVFGSTYSVGKLGELPYTPLPRTRTSLSQPPWVVAANRQALSDPSSRDKLLAASSLTTETVQVLDSQASQPRSQDSEQGMEDGSNIHGLAGEQLQLK